jgi:hypothetical protein
VIGTQFNFEQDFKLFFVFEKFIFKVWLWNLLFFHVIKCIHMQLQESRFKAKTL